MKKLLVLGLALFFAAALALPASALENEFGGYMEINLNMYRNLDYVDEGTTGDWDGVRARTRLYYTAKFSDKFRFVNQFEMDTVFGEQTGGYGDLGSDGVQVEVKRSYLDFELANFRFELGTQGFQLHRGLVIDDDASGFKVSWRGAEKTMIPALWWWRLNDGDLLGTTSNSTRSSVNTGADVDHYVALLNIRSGGFQIVPSVSYLTSNNGTFYSTTGKTVAGQAMNIFFAGLDVNWKMDKFGLEFTGVYETGELTDTRDISAYALWGKASFKIGNFGLWGAALYTTGEETANAGDFEGFWYPEQNGTGATFKTSELVRKGDDWTKLTRYENGSSPENRMEFGVGVDFAVTKNVKLFLSFWNLNLAEDAASGDDDVGNEIDVKATINLLKGLDLNLIGAYLIVGDAYKPATNDSSSAMELSAMLTLRF